VVLPLMVYILADFGRAFGRDYIIRVDLRPILDGCVSTRHKLVGTWIRPSNTERYFSPGCHCVVLRKYSQSSAGELKVWVTRAFDNNKAMHQYKGFFFLICRRYCRKCLVVSQKAKNWLKLRLVSISFYNTVFHRNSAIRRLGLKSFYLANFVLCQILRCFIEIVPSDVWS
jgi:hypothetical protein